MSEHWGKRAYGAAWTDERVQTLRELHAEGLSYSVIAARLGGGISRNAAIGKATRLGLVARAPKAPRTSFSRQRVRRTKPFASGRFPVPPRVEQAPGESSFPHDGPAPVLSIPPEERVGLLDLKDSMCRYPFGHVGEAEFGFCGRKTAGGSYCPDHHDICSVPAQPRSKRGTFRMNLDINGPR